MAEIDFLAWAKGEISRTSTDKPTQPREVAGRWSRRLERCDECGEQVYTLFPYSPPAGEPKRPIDVCCWCWALMTATDEVANANPQQVVETVDPQAGDVGPMRLWT